ncbi:MAG: butyrate kinase [Bacteroidales bacterium]|nr:butyrate kinase [Bacteroidales bacterium]
MDTNSMNLEAPQKGNILIINTGSTTTKLGYFSDGERVFDTKLEHTAEEVAKYPSVMDQSDMRRQAIKDFMSSRGIPLEDVDIVMARGGLFTPVITGVYNVNPDMREVLATCRDGNHACNLSAILADDIAKEINDIREKKGLSPRFGVTTAYVADPPMADEMLPECKMGGLPEFTRKTLFHALNSRAIVRRYLREHGHKTNDVTVIVAHMGGGATISLHRNGRVLDTNHGLGGDGPITPERAGCCPPFDLIDMCYSGKYTKEEVKKKLVGRGGAVAYFGTNSMLDVENLAKSGNELAQTFLKAYVLNICKYIAAMAATADGKVDAILLTGGIARSKDLMAAITEKIKFIAPVEVYPGEDEINSLAENGYMILSGKTKIHTYNKDRLIED